MRKIFIAVIFLLLIGASCSAETGMKYIDAKLDADKLSEANSDLSQIEIDFCDKPGEKSINYSLFPGSTQDICLKATNTSDKDIEVTIAFLDGTTTNDQRQNKACMQQGEDKTFGQYVTGFAASFIVPANNLMYQHAKFSLPRSSSGSGTINGCLVYYTKSVAMGGGLNFSVLMRKAKFIDIKVRDYRDIKRYLFWILGIAFLIYYSRSFFFSKNTKKLPKK